MNKKISNTFQNANPLHYMKSVQYVTIVFLKYHSLLDFCGEIFNFKNNKQLKNNNLEFFSTS